MKNELFIGIYFIHELICLSFCIWYLFFDGYLGYGYGDMFYLFPIIGITLISTIGLFFINKFSYHVRLFFGLLLPLIDAFVLYLYFQS